MSLALLAGFASRADIDEAWLHRAELPPTARPLLALVLDRSAATSASVAVREDYDPARNYGDEIVDAPRCDPAKAYFRRGAGAPPDCARQAGIDLAPRDAATGLHCAAALAPLATQGFFVASRAAQWQAGTGGGHWDALRDESAAAVECRADRGRHGATAGDWYAADGGVTPWTRDSTEEIPWDFAPFADSHVFFSGNYLNYLRTSLPITDRPTAEVMARRLAAALAATTELDVALLRVDDDGPQGGYVARAPVSSEIAAGEVMALAAAAPAGAAPLAETLTEAARWLAGGARRFGLDARTDAAALDPRAPAAYVSPFDHACRPVSLGFLTVGVASDDDLAVTAAESLPRFREETGGCGTDCLATLAAWLGDTDLRDDLPGTQSAPVSWLLPSLLPDPLAFVDLVAKAHQRDAAVAAGPQLSAAALMPFEPRTGAPGVVYGLMAPRLRERWTGNLLQYALRAPTGPFEPPLVVDREGAPAIDATGLPAAGTQSLWSDTPDANLLAGGAAGRLPTPDARNLFVNVASDRLTDPANQLAPGNARIDREALGLGALDAGTPDGLVAAFVAERSLGDPGLDAPLIAEYPAAGMRIAFSADQDGFLHAFEADSGVELWAWMPKELLGRVPRLARNAPTTARSHGIDGPLVLHR
ncbi:MAG TPA: hypothetical protein VFU77_00270, partial [Steroidobacteraceae bacterium]|nr:hypothetical protein [Steroidobacteraceae bacterium]